MNVLGQDVSREAKILLQASGYPALRNLTCEYHEGVLAIRGNVSSFYLKQLAHTLVRKVERVEVVADHIAVGI